MVSNNKWRYEKYFDSVLAIDEKGVILAKGTSQEMAERIAFKRIANKKAEEDRLLLKIKLGF